MTVDGRGTVLLGCCCSIEPCLQAVKGKARAQPLPPRHLALIFPPPPPPVEPHTQFFSLGFQRCSERSFASTSNSGTPYAAIFQAQTQMAARLQCKADWLVECTAHAQKSLSCRDRGFRVSRATNRNLSTTTRNDQRFRDQRW